MGDVLGSPRLAPLFRCLFFCPCDIPALMHRIPSELRSKACLGESSTWMGELLGTPRVAPHFRRWAPQGLSGGGPSVRGRVLMIIACAYNGRCDIPALMHRIPSELRSAIIPALMHRIPSELRSEACLGESSTWMGDLLGSPRVAPHFRCLFFCPFFRPPSGARHPRPGSSSPAGRASGRWAPQGLSGGGPSVRGGVLIIIACAYNGRCDHTSTNALDPIRTPQ
ncbi:hypothetical protein PIB30_104961 [Stylosanthes scabra]|uniref:Uncharacterized protein n=1 Tax=Stylosanthes scabra TaxID=79078 RepID=A0ABU6TZU8_9FABA|nr:hypothetical protein [Stylosanthes scabra]